MAPTALGSPAASVAVHSQHFPANREQLTSPRRTRLCRKWLVWISTKDRARGVLQGGDRWDRQDQEEDRSSIPRETTLIHDAVLRLQGRDMVVTKTMSMVRQRGA